MVDAGASPSVPCLLWLPCSSQACKGLTASTSCSFWKTLLFCSMGAGMRGLKGAARGPTVDFRRFGGGTGLGAPHVASPTQAREPGRLRGSVAPAAPATEHSPARAAGQVSQEGGRRCEASTARRANGIHAAILLLACACATSHTLKATEDSKFENLEHQEASGERQEGPWTVTTTDDEYERGASSNDQSPLVDAPDGTGQREQRPVSPQDAGVTSGAPHLIRHTVTVEQHGPINEAWRSSSDGLAGAETHLDLEKVDKAAPSFGCAFGLGLGGAIALVALGLLAYWRLK